MRAVSAQKSVLRTARNLHGARSHPAQPANLEPTFPAGGVTLAVPALPRALQTPVGVTAKCQHRPTKSCAFERPAERHWSSSPARSKAQPEHSCLFPNLPIRQRQGTVTPCKCVMRKPERTPAPESAREPCLARAKDPCACDSIGCFPGLCSSQLNTVMGQIKMTQSKVSHV